jgi:hypothetical protein
LKLVFIFTLVKFYLLTVKFTKTWQLRKKLLKKLQRKPLPRKRKLQRRKNNFGFLESKKYQSPGFTPGLLFFYTSLLPPSSESLAPPAFQRLYQYSTPNVEYSILNFIKE